MGRLGAWFDGLEGWWESAAGRRGAATFLVSFFLLSLLAIEANRQGWLPAPFAGLVARNHLVAIEHAFTLLLAIEVVGLVLALSRSVSRAVGKQMEILSLILLRSTFKEISHFDEPLLWSQVEPSLLPILASAAGALLIFVVLGFFSRIHREYPICRGKEDKSRFILAKKGIALLMLAGFVLIAGHDLWAYLRLGQAESVFEKFYTLLIFCDVLLVLISLRYGGAYLNAFRNSGFAVVTVLIRLALIAPPVVGAMLGSGASLFALAVAFAYNRFMAVDPAACPS